VKSPFEATRALPEFNGIILAFVEEPLQIAKNGRRMELVWIQRAVENVFSQYGWNQ